MNLYLLSQEANSDYDTHDSCIVAANTEEEARQINPGGPWGKAWTTWAETPDQVDVEYIGIAVEDTKAGVILASFNAG